MATERITSRDNQRLVNARKVRDGKIANQIFIEGKRLAVEAFRSGVEVAECFLREGFHDKHLAEVIAERNCDVSELPDRIFESIADTKNSQGIVLIGKRPAHTLESIKRRLNSSPVPIVVVLTEINNPSNLGAVLRTAEAAGIAGVIVTENSADAYSAKTLRASMGAAFRLPIVEYANFRDILHWAKAEGITTTAAAATAPKTYADIDWMRKRLLIFGSEAHGLENIDIEQIDETVSIPMENNVESLNLAVSAGILLFEARRQNVSG